MGFIKENGKWTYRLDPGEKRMSEKSDVEHVKAINKRHEKASSMTAREILSEIESGKCSPNFLSEEQFKKWKADVLAGKFDRRR